MKRTVRRVAGYTAVALGCLSLLLYLARDPVRDALGRAATAWVSHTVHGTLTVGALRGSILSSLILHDVLLRDAQGTTVIQIAEVRLRYDLLALFTGRLLLREAEIIQPYVKLLQAPDGTWNLDRLVAGTSPTPATAPSSQGPPIALEIQRFQIHDGALALQTPTLPGVQHVHGIHFAAHGQADAQGFRLHVAHGTATASPAGVVLHTLQGVISGHGRALRLDALRLQTEQTLLTGAGVLPGGSQASDLALHLQPLETAEIGRLLQREELYGPVSLTLTVQGPPQALRLQAQLQAAQGQIEVHSTVDTQATPWRYGGQMAVSHADLAALLHREALQSDVNLQVQVEGEGLSMSTFRGRIQFDAQASHLGSLTLSPSQVIVTAADGRFQVQRCELQTSFARLTAAGSLERAGNSALHYALTLDLGGLRALLGHTTLDGTLHMQGEAHGEGAAFRAQGVLEAHHLRYDEVYLTDLRLTYEGTQLGTQPQATTQLTAQQVRLGGMPVEHLSLQASYAHAEQQLQISTEVRQSDLAAGKLRGTLHWSETSQHLILHEVLLQLAERAWRLESPAEMVRDAQGLRLERLALTHADERLELAGTTDSLEQQDVHLQISRLDLTFLQRLLSLPRFLQGQASLQAHLTGTAAAPRVDLAMTLQPDASRSTPFDQLRATLTYAQQQLRSEIQVRQAARDLLTLEAQLPVDLALIPLPLAQRLLPQPVALQIRVRQPDLTTLSRWQATWPGLSGALEASLKVHGTYAALALEAEAHLQQFGLRGGLQQVNGPLHLQATLGLPGMPAEPGHVSPSAELPFLQLRQAVLRLPTLRGQLVRQDQPARAFQVQNLEAHIAGQWTAAGLDSTLKALRAQVRLADLPRAELSLAGRLTPQGVELTRLRLRLPHSEMQGSGTLTFPHHQLQLRLDIPRLHLDEVGIAPPSPLPALVQGMLEVRGHVAAPQVETHLQYAGGQLVATLAAYLQEPVPRYNITLRLDDLAMAALLPGEPGQLRATLHAQGAGFSAPHRRAQVDLRLETSHLRLAPGLVARLQGSLSGSMVRVDEFQLRSTPVVATAQGTLAISPGDKTSLTYAITSGDLTSLQQYFGIPVQGKGSLNGTLQGTWPLLQARSRLRVGAWTYMAFHGRRLQADLTLSQFPSAPQATLKAQVVDLSGATRPASSLDVQASYTAPQGTVHMQVTAGPYRKTAFDGHFSLAPEQRFTMTRLRVQYNNIAWNNVTPLAVVRSAQGRIDLQRGLLRSGRQELSAQGILTPEGTMEAHIQLQRVQLLPLVRFIAPDIGPVDGQISLQFGLYGTVSQPRVEGAIDLVGLRWHQHDVGNAHGQFSTVGTTIQFDLRWQEQARQLLRVYGTVGLDTPHALDFRLHATEVDLDLVAAFSPEVTQSAGRLNVDLHLAGTFLQPSLHGRLELRDGTLQLAATGARYTGLQASMVFAGQHVDVTQFHAESGDGSLDMRGWATSAGLTLTHLECTLYAQRFTALHTPDIEAVVSGALTVRGSLEDLSATGTLTLPRVRAQLGGKLGGGPEAVQPWQLMVESVYGAGPRHATSQQASPEPDQRSPLAFLRTDLRLDLPHNIWVRGPGTAVELQGAVTITKELRQPFVLSGQVETVRGFTSLYTGKFTVERGHIEFTGTPEINPVLDMVVTREVGGYVVSVNVTGRAKAPQLHLSSTPELQQADIVTLLVVGKTTERLTPSERRALSGQAQQIVGNVAAGEVERLLAKPLGFDTVDIQTGGNLGSSKVSVGRYVTQNIFLSYEQQLGDESGNKVGVEYSVNRHLKLKGSSTNKGAAALDLLWRIDY